MNFWLSIGLTAALGITIEALVLLMLLPMLKRSGVVRENFQEVYIPAAVGITFPITILLCYIALELAGVYGGEVYTLYLAAVALICLLGLLDDLIGTRESLGFRGHFSRLFKGELTTGALKALGVGFISLFLAVFLSSDAIDIVVNTLLLALFTNIINLLDLRPGRAIKGFLFFAVIIMLLVRVDYLMFIPLMAAVLFYFPFDLRAKAMMGDAGSNVLGFSLGLACVMGMEFSFRVGTVILLILIHIFTEKYSLTKIIERVGVLRYLDELGRS
ncbi:MAG: hypothetical protein GX964_05805 [Syntrophomonadaceae bacterium]|nr:hypothetical protein [Syntrophomonadaceae bacterium]